MMLPAAKASKLVHYPAKYMCALQHKLTASRHLPLKLKYKSNVELNIRPYCIPGYSMIDGNDIFYNRKVLSILETYRQKFGCVFEMLSRQNKSVYELDDLFIDPKLDKTLVSMVCLLSHFTNCTFLFHLGKRLKCCPKSRIGSTH